jgi:hypothetical protein
MRRPGRYRPFAELDELALAVEHLGRASRVHREEFGEAHGEAIQHFLERGDRGADAALLDQGDHAVRDPGALRELALGEAVHLADGLQPRRDVIRHDYPDCL